MTTPANEVSAPRLIGGVSPDPRRAGCVRVTLQEGTGLGSRSILTIPRETVAELRLVPGGVLKEAMHARLCRAADAEAAFRTALRLLERRPFAVRDLGRRLVLKGHPADAAEAAVVRAREAGLLDDARFALHFVETRAARGRGPLRLRRDLAVLGVEREVVDRALREAFGPDGAAAPSAEALARKRLGQLQGLAPAVQRRRLLAYLGRRGFGGAGAVAVVGALLQGER